MREQLRAALCSYRHCLQNRDESSLSRAAKELRRYMLQFDPYYPSYHYCGPEGRVGDPNGVCKVGDIYHLFCQHRPVLGEKLAPTCWGHAYSSDLIHWVDAPIALYPDTPYDQNGCYSGNIIADGQGDPAGDDEGDALLDGDGVLTFNVGQGVCAEIENDVLPIRDGDALGCVSCE